MFSGTIARPCGLKTYGLAMVPENMTLENFRYILFKWKLTRDAIWNSSYLSLSAALVTMIAGTMISYVIVKTEVPRRDWNKILIRVDIVSRYHIMLVTTFCGRRRGGRKPFFAEGSEW